MHVIPGILDGGWTLQALAEPLPRELPAPHTQFFFWFLGRKWHRPLNLTIQRQEAGLIQRSSQSLPLPAPLWAPRCLELLKSQGGGPAREPRCPRFTLGGHRQPPGHVLEFLTANFSTQKL